MDIFRRRIRKRENMKTIYCGNNRLLVTRKNRLGTRHTCMKKGFGVGYHLPADKKYMNGYEPIDNVNIYCGNKEILPDHYDRFGNLADCIQKGVSIGQIKKARETFGKRRRRTMKMQKTRKTRKIRKMLK
jgi:hypothetical protein